MTGTELRDLIIAAIRRLEPGDDNVALFRAAATVRQQYGDCLDKQEGLQGLSHAFDHVLAWAYRTNKQQDFTDFPREYADGAFIESLAMAAAVVPQSRYDELALKFERYGGTPTTTGEVDVIVIGALREFARISEENLSPGP